MNPSPALVAIVCPTEFKFSDPEARLEKEVLAGVAEVKTVRIGLNAPFPDEVLDDEELANYKSKLLEYTQSRGMGIPSYDVLQESGPEHQKSFVVGVFVQNQEWGRGSGNSKKSAEQAGARVALTNMTGTTEKAAEGSARGPDPRRDGDANAAR